MKDVANFLRNIGLDRYTTSFTEQGISGDLLLEADNEMLRELGVESPLDQLKILTLFRRRIMGQKSKYVGICNKINDRVHFLIITGGIIMTTKEYDLKIDHYYNNIM